MSPQSVHTHPAMHMPRGRGITQRARPVCGCLQHTLSSAHGADMVGESRESRNMSDAVLFTPHRGYFWLMIFCGASAGAWLERGALRSAGPAQGLCGDVFYLITRLQTIKVLSNRDERFEKAGIHSGLRVLVE